MLGQIWMIGFFIAVFATLTHFTGGSQIALGSPMLTRALWLAIGAGLVYSCYVFWRRRDHISVFAGLWLLYALVLVLLAAKMGWVVFALAGAIMLYIDRELNRKP